MISQSFTFRDSPMPCSVGGDLTRSDFASPNKVEICANVGQNKAIKNVHGM